MKDITGKVSGRLTAVERIGANKYRRGLWLCTCTCGGQKVVTITDVLSKKVKSCGCLPQEIKDNAVPRRQRQREGYYRNREKRIQQVKDYNEKNKDQIRQRNAKHYKENRLIVLKKVSAYQKANKDKLTKQRRIRRESDPVYKIAVRLRSSVSRIKLRGVPDSPRVSSSVTAKNYVNKFNKLGWFCRICKKEQTMKESTIDHIVPISNGGSNELNNLQPLCQSCNASKGNRHKKRWK